MPTTFKTPGSKVNVNTGNQILLGPGGVCDEPVMLKLCEMRQESLRRMKERMAPATEVSNLPPNGGMLDGTGPAPSVPPPA
jgi:hypothetical protein